MIHLIVKLPNKPTKQFLFKTQKDTIKFINENFFSGIPIINYHNLFFTKYKSKYDKFFFVKKVSKDFSINRDLPFLTELIKYDKMKMKKINVDINYMENKLKKDNPTLEQSTIKLYLTHYINVSKLLEKKPNSRWLMNSDPNKILIELKKHYSPSTLSPILTALFKILYAYGEDKLAEKYVKIKQSLPKKKENTKTQRQKDNWITKKEVEEFVKKLEKKAKESGNEIDYRQYLTLLIMFHHPLRNDLAGLLLTNKDLGKDKNYYNYKTGTITLNKYKTSKTYGQKKIKLNKEVKKDVNEYLSANDFKQKYLIQNNKGEELTNSALSKMLIRLFEKEFKKKIGSQMLRHILLDNETNNNFIKSKKKFETENEKLIDTMGHNTQQHSKYILTE